MDAELAAANRIAQRCFHEMLSAGVQGNANDPRTRAYVAAERLVDELMVEAQGQTAFEAMDELAAGDHHFYPAEVG